VVSKNDPVHAKRPFVDRKEMILSYDDFVYFNASWNDKHHAIDEIIRSLNLGRDQVCFLDDSSFERDQACKFLPGLVVPELDPDPEQRLETLIRSGIFARPMVRTEDKARVEMYKTERDRQEFAKHIYDADEYLRSLEIKLGAIPVTTKILSRVTQLVQKTNQFNITNKRMEADQILNLAKDKENFAYGYSVSDKFGDAGLVGVLVGTRDGDFLDIDVWVLSCRVFNRTIEQGMFAHLLDWCLGQGVRAIRAVYNPSPKNHLVAGFLPALGFAQTPDSGSGDLKFICDCDATQPKPHNVQILDPE
jgi:FkbH-like protein